MKFNKWDFLSPVNGILKYINAYILEEYVQQNQPKPDLDSNEFKAGIFDWLLWVIGIGKIGYDDTGKVVRK